MKGQLRHDPAWLDAFFQRADEIFVSFSGGDYPYVLPLNFVWPGRTHLSALRLYGPQARPAPAGRPRGLRRALDVTIVRERSTTWYKSVSGCGHIRIVEDTEEKRRALDALSLRYARAACPRPAPEAMLRRVNVLCIDVESISGKERTPS